MSSLTTGLVSFVYLLSKAQGFVAPWYFTEQVRPSLMSNHRIAAATQEFANSMETIQGLTKENPQVFDWFKSWYPIVPVEILDKEKPHSFQLLGQDIVVWYDGVIEGDGIFQPKSKRRKGAKRSDQGTWRAFIDQCPHRKVPLSEGRVEDDGTLLCSYHAWRFNGDGACVDIPQVESKDELARIKSNPKTSCNAFPTKVINGLLFVWPSADENAILESELTPVKYPPSIADKERLWEGPWNYRELPYGADFFIENVVDPAHVQVSHHNVVGSRYNNQVMKMFKVKPLTKNGFAVGSYSNAQISTPATTTFEAPSMVTIESPFSDDGGVFTLELHVAPSRPGFCHHVGRQVIVKDRKGTMPQLLKAFAAPLPKWALHVMASTFLNQDGLFLHHQERALARTGEYSSVLKEGEHPYHYTKAVYPVNADMGVILFRNWLRVMAGGENSLQEQSIDASAIE